MPVWMVLTIGWGAIGLACAAYSIGWCARTWLSSRRGPKAQSEYTPHRLYFQNPYPPEWRDRDRWG
jgi:hypothetical protein